MAVSSHTSDQPSKTQLLLDYFLPETAAQVSFQTHSQLSLSLTPFEFPSLRRIFRMPIPTTKGTLVISHPPPRPNMPRAAVAPPRGRAPTRRTRFLAGAPDRVITKLPLLLFRFYNIVAAMLPLRLLLPQFPLLLFFPLASQFLHATEQFVRGRRDRKP